MTDFWKSAVWVIGALIVLGLWSWGVWSWRGEYDTRHLLQAPAETTYTVTHDTLRPPPIIIHSKPTGSDTIPSPLPSAGMYRRYGNEITPDGIGIHWTVVSPIPLSPDLTLELMVDRPPILVPIKETAIVRTVVVTEGPEIYPFIATAAGAIALGMLIGASSK